MPQSPDRVCVWRIVLIPAALVATATHVPITKGHLEEAPYIGFLFLLLEAAGLVLAVLLMRREDRLLYVACAALGGLAILAYILSRSIGLPQIRDDVGNWAEPLGVVAVAAQAVLLFGGLAAVVVSSGRPVGIRNTPELSLATRTTGKDSNVCANERSFNSNPAPARPVAFINSFRFIIIFRIRYNIQ